MFYNKDLLKNFAKFTGKHLYRSFFFNKVAGLRPATLLKKILRYMCFPKFPSVIVFSLEISKGCNIILYNFQG